MFSAERVGDVPARVRRRRRPIRSFIDLIPTPQIWTDYCDAFADEAA